MITKHHVYLFLIWFMLSTSFCVSSRHMQMEAETDHLRQELIETSRQFIGTTYKYAGRTPDGFDCSGFIHYVFNDHDIHLPPVSREQAKLGSKQPINKASPGDLLFFGDRSGIDHVGLITKNTSKGLWIIHSTSIGVLEENVYDSRYWRNRLQFARNVVDAGAMP